MYPEKIKHMLFNISSYFHHEINTGKKKQQARNDYPYTNSPMGDLRGGLF